MRAETGVMESGVFAMGAPPSGTGRQRVTPLLPAEFPEFVGGGTGVWAITGRQSVSWARAIAAGKKMTTPRLTVHGNRIVQPSLANEIVRRRLGATERKRAFGLVRIEWAGRNRGREW